MELIISIVMILALLFLALLIVVGCITAYERVTWKIAIARIRAFQINDSAYAKKLRDLQNAYLRFYETMIKFPGSIGREAADVERFYNALDEQIRSSQTEMPLEVQRFINATQRDYTYVQNQVKDFAKRITSHNWCASDFHNDMVRAGRVNPDGSYKPPNNSTTAPLNKALTNMSDLIAQQRKNAEEKFVNEVTETLGNIKRILAPSEQMPVQNSVPSFKPIVSTEGMTSAMIYGAYDATRKHEMKNPYAKPEGMNSAELYKAYDDLRRIEQNLPSREEQDRIMNKYKRNRDQVAVPKTADRAINERPITKQPADDEQSATGINLQKR